MTALVPDCASCFSLCCVALPYARGADFPFDKDAGVPCTNLLADSSCGVHDDLLPLGFRGCVAYDCFGAGQRTSQQTFHGVDWRTGPAVAQAMFAVFPVVRALHEVLRYVAEAALLPAAVSLRPELAAAADRVDRLAAGDPESLRTLDLPGVRNEVALLLRRASALARDPAGPVVGKAPGGDFRGADLRRGDLRGALLVGADLSGADLSGADVIGADLRGADLRGAVLTDVLFLTPQQASAAVGDGATLLPATVSRPDRWA